VNRIKHFFEVILNLARVSSNGQNLEEIRVGAEVETREDTSLLFEISLKLPLAVLQIFLHLGQSAQEQVVLAAWDDQFLLGDALHDLLPLSVSLLENLRLLWHLFGDLTTSEDEHKTHPLLHDLEPLLESFGNCSESVKLALDFCPEGSNATSGKHLHQLHHVVFELLLMLGDSATDCAWVVEVLICVDLQLC